MKRRLVAGIAVCAAVATAAWTTSPAAVFAPLERIAGAPIMFGIALVALAAFRPFLALPTTLLAVGVGYGYGWSGVPLGIALLTLTAIPPYVLSRVGWRGTSGRLVRTGERVVDLTGGTRAVVASRFLPLPSDVVSVGAGVSRVDLRPFLLGTAIGETPWVVAGVAVGVSADHLLAGDISVLDPTLFVGMIGVAALLLAGPCYRTYTGRSKRSMGPL
ncbi:TVP38/TMEM64 family protein [Halopenitus sp. H-Gu1]|uniref:TVP38/TMEM64 family protein n=1 Tax=Halopenitus sp. H-Gu1 TaxID=3242697 RepID=UPI00359EBB18